MFLVRQIWRMFIEVGVMDKDMMRNMSLRADLNDNPVYRQLCSVSAEQVIKRYTLYLDDGYTIGGFICVNGSPSCGVDFCHRAGNRCNEQGVFIEEFLKIAKKDGIEIPLIGFRAKELDTILASLRSLCEKSNVSVS